MNAADRIRLRLLARKNDWRALQLEEAPLAAPQPGEVLLRIERFAFTANNVTYAAFGDAMHYWQFFPAPEGWGCIPVWGFATVAQSRCDGVAEGERFYGYLPMATHVLLAPERIDEEGFSDGTAHRRGLPAVYNRYLRCSADALYRAGHEPQQMLLRPLFTTSFLIDDFLAAQGFFGARCVLLSSASSKTAYGTAFCLSQRAGLDIVGLTSEVHREFVRSLGVYHGALSYDRIGALDAAHPAVYVDFSGSGPVRSAIHAHYRDRLAYSCAVGGTHWRTLGGASGLPGPKPVLFFAPAQIKQRTAEWGAGGLQQRIAAAWHAFMQRVTDPARPWLEVTEAHGPEAARTAVLQLIDGVASPRQGHVLSLWSQP
jgi:hypothetical protein